MPKLPVMTGKALIKVLAQLGYIEVRRKSSHVRLECPGRGKITIPDHGEIGSGLFRRIMRDSNMTTEEYIKLFENKKKK